MKVIEIYFPVVLFIMLYKMVLTFESVDEILACDHSNESYLNGHMLKKKHFSRGVVYYTPGLCWFYVFDFLECDHCNESY